MLAVIDSLTSVSVDQYQDTYDNLMKISSALVETNSDDFVIFSERAGELSCIIFALQVSLNLPTSRSQRTCINSTCQDIFDCFTSIMIRDTICFQGLQIQKYFHDYLNTSRYQNYVPGQRKSIEGFFWAFIISVVFST